MAISILARMQAARRGLTAVLGRQCIVRHPVDAKPGEPVRTAACLGRLVPGDWACLDCQKRLRHQDMPQPIADKRFAADAQGEQHA
jgi:hypothetical protein